jgi:hypothetical protein
MYVLALMQFHVFPKEGMIAGHTGFVVELVDVVEVVVELVDDVVVVVVDEFIP